MADNKKILGIDLGTTNSCMAIIADGELVVIPNAEGEKTTPSIVSFLKDGQIAAGQPAKRLGVTNPFNTIFSAKRFIGRKFEESIVQSDTKVLPFALEAADNGDCRVRIDGKAYSPPEIAAIVLAKLKSDAESYLNESIEAVVITVPAYFNDAQRQATKDAGRIAGLDVKRIVNEPTAASMACGLDQLKNQSVVVYDLGGGTFDVTILKLGKGVFDVTATNGDTHLGGDDFDHAIVQMLMDEFEKNEGIDLSGDKLALQRLKEAAETAKIQLSTQVQVEVNLPFITQDAQGPRHMVTSITRELSDAICIDLVKKTLKPCDIALRDAKLTANQIDEVILVGGMTRMPAVKNAVEKFFGCGAHDGVNPDEAVAVGAAIQGGILKGDVRDKLLLDVTPLSLGVRTHGGLFSKVIEKNTSVPTREEQTYTTANDNQVSVRISVYQGENPLAADNMFLGDFELLNIRSASKGVPQIDVSFDINANGLLRVSAKDKDTKQVQNIRIEPNSGLKEEEIASMVQAAKNQALKSKKSNESDQYQMTCTKLIEESKKEIAQGQGVHGDSKTAMLSGLANYQSELEGAQIVRLKEMLRELNQALVQIRSLNKTVEAKGGGALKNKDGKIGAQE